MAVLSSRHLRALPHLLSSPPFPAKAPTSSPTITLTISYSPTRALCNSTSQSVMEETHLKSTSEIPHNPKNLDFPIPVSPPPPPISKEIEYSRAMAANSRTVVLKRSDIIFEDEWLVVVNKASGVYSECVLSSIPALLDAPAKSMELHLANRLDRDTSGLMVITKLHKAAAKLVKAFTDHGVKKTYIALCIGPAPKWKQISVRSGHGRSKFGLWRVYSASDIGRGLPGGTLVKEMSTSLEVLAANGHGSITGPTKGKINSETDCFSGKLEMLVVEDKVVPRTGMESDEILIRAYPQSGRTHQIRLHCQYLGVPIRGDVKYEGVHEWRGRTYDTHALHAESLSFDHPMTGARLEFRAPLPSWARDTCQQPIRS